MEKKNLTVLVDTANSIASADENFGSGVAGEVTLYSAEDQQAVVGSAITALTVGQGFFFAVVNSDGSITKSDTIMPQNMVRLTEQAAVVAVGQETTISAVSNVDCETEYCVTINYHSPVIAKNYGYQAMKKTYSYVTRCCGTSCGCPDGAVWDALTGLAGQLNDDQESGMNLTMATAKTLLYAEVINSNALVEASHFSETGAVFTQGSNKVVWPASGGTAANKGDHGANVATAVGDWVRVKPGGGVVALTDGIYRVEAVENIGAHSATLTLDRPWPHATFTADADGDTEVILKATMEAKADSTFDMTLFFADGASNDGIVDDSGAGSMTYIAPYVVSAEVGLGCNLDCNATVTTGTDAAQPELIGYSVIQQELWANKGASKKFGPYAGTTLYSRPVSGEDYFATAATNYTFCYTIDWVDTSPSAATDSFMPRPKRLKIYTTGSTISDELNVMFDSFNVDFNTPFVQLG